MVRMLRSFSVVLFLATSVVCSADSISLPAPLNDLIGNETTVAGQLFSDFAYVASGDMPDASGLTVVALTGESDQVELRFQGAFADTASAGEATATISYRVTLDAGQLATHSVLQGNPAVLGGDGLGEVTTQLNDGFVVRIFDDGHQQHLLDSLTLDPQLGGSFMVEHDLRLAAGTESDGVVLSFVDHSISLVPEPSCFALAGVGLLCLGGFRRRVR